MTRNECEHGQLRRSCQICDLVEERDALAAHVERIHSAVWSQASKQYPSTDSINIADVLTEVHRDAKSSLVKIKAQWQAEALEELAEVPKKWWPGELLIEANKRRRQAGGGEV